MPKEVFEIKEFQSGTITSPDIKDVPDDAAEFSLNLSIGTTDGRLKGLPEDSATIVASGANEATLISKGDGTRDYIYYKSDDTVHKVEDFYGGSASDSSLGSVTNSANVATMAVNNREVHIGMGSGASDTPKWVGYMGHKQFGAAISGITMEDASIDKPSAVPIFYKTVGDADYVYGVTWQGSSIFKYDHKASAVGDQFVLSKNAGNYSSITGLCKDSANSGYLLVFDSGAGTYGTLYKVSETTLLPVESYPILGWNTAGEGLDTNATISDIHMTGTGATNYEYTIWFLAYKTTRWGEGTPFKILSSIQGGGALSNGTGITPANKTWTMDYTSSEGAWAVTPDLKIEKAALTSVNENDVVGVIVEANSKNIYVNSTTHTDNFKSGIILVNKDQPTIGQKFDQGTDPPRILILGNYNTNAATDRYSRGVAQVTPNSAEIIVTRAAGSGGVNTTISTYALTAYASAGFISVGDDYAFPATVLAVDYSTITGNVPTGTHSSTFALLDSSGGTTANLMLLSTQNSGVANHVAFSSASNGSYTLTKRAGSNLSITTTPIPDGGTIGQDDVTTYQHYRASFLYDGYQESPLSDGISIQELADEKYAVGVAVRIAATVSKRVTAVRIYRSEATSSTPTTLYRLVKEVVTTDDPTGWASVTSTSDPYQKAMGNHYSSSFVETGSLLGSYEALSGVSQTLDNITPNYGLSATVNNTHFIAKCSHPDIDDANLFLFKSKPGDFDRFDWSVDVIKLPQEPTALAAFAGRIYAFDENNTYRISTDPFYIEDIFEGVGAINKHSVTVTEYGMLICSQNNVYLHNGKVPEIIGEAIKKDDVTGHGWENITASTVKTTFDSRNNSFLIFTQLAGNSSYAPFTDEDGYFVWQYNLPRKRWDLAEYDISDLSRYPLSVISGKNGEPITSKSTGVVTEWAGGSNVRQWDWVSKKLTMGQDTQTKMFKVVRILASTMASGLLTQIHSSGGSNITKSYTNRTDHAEYKLTDANRKAKHLQLQITNSQNTVDSIGVIFRRRPVK
tara:strand:+ start:2677 stop:5745 length:3069 start_codon:yes stop_codon:yes gene_type:complete